MVVRDKNSIWISLSRKEVYIRLYERWREGGDEFGCIFIFVFSIGFIVFNSLFVGGYF